MTREAGIFFLYNPFIHVAAQSSNEAREVCPFATDVTLVNAQSHMHARGVSYVADLLDAGGSKVQELYTTRTWQHVVSKPMDPPLTISAGQMIDFRCSYTNNETHDINQGRTTRDEMCMFLGLYYPKDAKTEVCSMTTTGAAATSAPTGSGPARDRPADRRLPADGLRRWPATAGRRQHLRGERVPGDQRGDIDGGPLHHQPGTRGVRHRVRRERARPGSMHALRPRAVHTRHARPRRHQLP